MVRIHGESVEFRFTHPLARRVFLVGDFNGWKPEELAMGRESSGQWVARLRLPPGGYRFRYLADGLWFSDYEASGVVSGPGGADSLAWVARPCAGRRARRRPGSVVRSVRAG